MVRDYLDAMGGHKEKLLVGVSLKFGGYEWLCRTDQRLAPILDRGTWRSLEECEAKQHVVLLSPGGWKPGGWSSHPEPMFRESDADCIATANGWIDRDNPKIYQINKPVIFDLDHVAPGTHDPALVWKAFTQCEWFDSL